MRQIVSIRLEQAILADARDAAEKQGLTLTRFVERAVRRELEGNVQQGMPELRRAGMDLRRLSDLLIGMTPEAMHEAFDWGPDHGRDQVD